MLTCQFVLLGFLIAGEIQDLPTPATLGRQILDDALPAEKRRQLAADNADRAAEIVTAMVVDLPADDAAEEYRRIPWIWRVSIAAGRRNQEVPLRALLDVTLPKEGEKMRDWQAVVIGGGIINGISLSGGWPKPRIEELMGKDESLRHRWEKATTAAATMADDAQVKTGTRYDALRMIALDSTELRLKQLAKYLAKDANPELQMGAVSGLSDVDQPEAAKLLAESLPGLAPDNRVLAVDALLRTNARVEALLGLLESGKIAPRALSEPQRKRLRELPAGKLRDRVEAILKPVQ